MSCGESEPDRTTPNDEPTTSLTLEQRALLEKVVDERKLALQHQARRFVRDPETAQDVVQEALCRLVARPPRLQTERAYASFLFATVHNLALKVVRKRQRGAACVARLAVSAKARARRDEVTDGSTTAQRAEEGSALRSALERLTSIERDSTRLVYLEDQTVPDAARRLSVEPKAVRRAVQRALDKLRRSVWWRTAGEQSDLDIAAFFRGALARPPGSMKPERAREPSFDSHASKEPGRETAA